MKIKILTLLLLPSISWMISSCTPTNERIQQELVKEVMVIHDDVMPKMDDIYRTQRELRALKPSASNQEDTTAINGHIQTLEDAGEGMMSWMAELNLPATNDTRSHEEIMTYLNKEKENITKVRDDMLNSIQEGKTFLENMKK